MSWVSPLCPKLEPWLEKELEPKLELVSKLPMLPMLPMLLLPMLPMLELEVTDEVLEVRSVT